MTVNSFFEKRVDQLFDLADLVEKAFSSAGLEYRAAGGLAAYLYVEESEPDAGRLPKISISPFGAKIQNRFLVTTRRIMTASDVML